jgi:hypothetical protein
MLPLVVLMTSSVKVALRPSEFWWVHWKASQNQLRGLRRVQFKCRDEIWESKVLNAYMNQIRKKFIQ